MPMTPLPTRSGMPEIRGSSVRSPITWELMGDASTFIGGIRALLVQAAHPEVVAGVADHSRYREDPLGRLSRTSNYVTATSYGAMPEVDAAVASGAARARQGARDVPSRDPLHGGGPGAGGVGPQLAHGLAPRRGPGVRSACAVDGGGRPVRHGAGARSAVSSAPIPCPRRLRTSPGGSRSTPPWRRLPAWWRLSGSSGDRR